MLLALSILGLLLVLAVASRLTARHAEKRYPARGKFSSGGVHYEDTGAGPVVVLIHGSDGCLQDFDPLIDELSSEFRVIVYDRPGHGYSTTGGRDTWRVSAQVQTLLTLLNELGIEKATVVGHSWGAAVALAFAQRYPKRVSGAVTLAGWMFVDRPPTPLLYVPLIPLLGYVISATLLFPIKGFLVLSSLREAFFPRSIDHEYRKLANALWQRHPWQTVHFARENTTAISELRRLTHLYNRIQAPTEIVFGSSDRVVDTARHSHNLQNVLTAARSCEIEAAGHELHRFHQATVKAAILSVTKQNAKDDQRLQNALLAHGACPDCWQSTNRGMEIIYEKNAVLAGVTCGSCWVSAGEPISKDPITVAQEKENVCWFGVGSDFKDALCSEGRHTAILIGSHPVWNPKNWTQKTRQHASLRAQIKRAENKGVKIQETRDPAGLVACQKAWLDRLAINPLKFLTEPVNFENAEGRQFFVAVRAGTIVGYLVACPIPATNGRLVEELARTPDAPNGTTEALVSHAMESFAKENVATVTLGLAPLSPLGAQGDPPIKGSVGFVLRWMRAHGKRFYNFEGIESFKAKMQPDEWLPAYALVRGKWKLRHIGAVIEAFTGEKPVVASCELALTAIKQELKWIVEKRTR